MWKALSANTASVVKGSAAKGFALSQVGPSRTGAMSHIEFTDPTNGNSTVTILNGRGLQVATLFNGRTEAGKKNQVRFNTTGLSKGLLFSKLDFEGQTCITKILLAD